MKSHVKHINWFDLELIGDDKVDKEIELMSMEIFKYWRLGEVLLINKQKITKWRPKDNIVLLSNRMDLMELYKQILKKKPPRQQMKVSVLFQSEAVIRFHFD